MVPATPQETFERWIGAGMAAYHRRPPDADPRVDMAGSRYVLHTTADPDVFVAEIDTALVCILSTA